MKLSAIVCYFVAVIPFVALAQGKFTGISEDPNPDIDLESETRLEDQLEKTILLNLNLVDVDFIDALEVIQTSAERIYSGSAPVDRQGVGFVVRAPTPTVKVTIRGEKVSLGLAVDEICRQAGMLWTNKGYSIFLKPGRRFTQRKSPFPGQLE